MSTNYGRCNICSTRARLTEDHVPPRGSWDPTHTSRVWVQKLIPKLKPPDKRIRRLSQNGLKFRTLCASCNNDLLGLSYDPALHQFSRKVGQIMRVGRRLTLPGHIDVDIQPANVARAVMGHLLAAELRADMALHPSSAPMQQSMRDYVLDSTLDLPPNLRVFVWPYWGKRQVVLRGVGVLFDLGVVSPLRMLVGDFLKYLPLAFMVTYDPPQPVPQKFARFELEARGHQVGQVVKHSVPTRMSDSLRPSWPESPNVSDALMLNDDVCITADMDEP
ncbi:MAG: hypothetical protein KDE27_02990 [Planctomycetes bacterium]|nr:hypothetical protein [Planctomycetota bacterium]